AVAEERVRVRAHRGERTLTHRPPVGNARLESGGFNRPTPSLARLAGASLPSECCAFRASCAQHGHHLGGASPLENRPLQSKRTATAGGRPTVERKLVAKPRADEQEADRRRRRAGRAGE